MRILFINNASTERCGVRAFGEQWVKALERAGDQVVVWDGTYSNVKANGYLPPNAQTFDLIHLNWDPQAINHYLPEHFFSSGSHNRPLSLFLHDVPPNSTCPVYDVARWRFAHEPYGTIDVLPHGVPPSPNPLDAPSHMGVTVGVTGIRDDEGFAAVRTLCIQRGWTLNAPSWKSGGRWLSTAEEIRRLSRSTVNVCWYHTSGRGKSMAAMFCAAARRPLILSGSTMFSACWPYEDEIYFPADFSDEAAHRLSWTTELEDLIDEVLDDLDEGEAMMPDRICDELSWDRVINRVRQAWAGVR